MSKFSRRRNSKKRKSVRHRKLKGGGDDNNIKIQCIKCNKIYDCMYYQCRCPNCGTLNIIKR